ncbi:MAG: hypothetical protein K2X87_26990 [Gemmataceae bacterium]|nr:hypothetical protein [Gemmataceae bacterium]
MRVRAAVIGTLLVALVAAGALFGFQRRSARTPAVAAEPDRVVAEPRSLDLGEVWESDKFEWPVTVRNLGAEPVRVSSLTAACSCVGSASSTVEVPPGEARPLPFVLDLRETCASAEPAAVRDVKLPLGVSVDPADAQPRSRWVVRGRVRSAVHVSARAIDLGRYPAGSAPRSRVVRIRELVPLSDLTADTDSPALAVRLKPAGSAALDLVVEPHANLPPGRYQAEVLIRPTTAAGTAPPPTRLPVEFEVLDDVQPDAPAVLLGPRPVGEVAEGTVTLRSFAGHALRDVTWTTDGPEVEVRPGDGDGTFVVRSKVARPGDQAGRVRFAGTAGGRPFVVSVEVRYYGLGGS